MVIPLWFVIVRVMIYACLFLCMVVFEDVISVKHLTSHRLVYCSEMCTNFTHTCGPADGFDEGCMVDCGFS